MKYNISGPVDERDMASTRDLFEVEDAALISVSGLTPVSPPAALFERIAQETATQPRFDRFAQSVASLLDLEIDQAKYLLGRLGDAAAWQPGFFRGMELQHAEGGPRVRDAVTGFVRLTEGSVFPEHHHLGDERILVLQGRCQDGDEVHGPGDVIEMAAGTSHSFRVCPGPDFVYLAVVHDGLRIGDWTIGPDDPRG